MCPRDGLRISIVPVVAHASNNPLDHGQLPWVGEGDVEMQEIPIYGRDLDPDQLVEDLTREVEDAASITFQKRNVGIGLRIPFDNPTVVVALITGGSAAVSALVTGLLRILERRKENSGILRIGGASGRTIEVPRDATEKELAQYVELARSLDRPTIEVDFRGKN